MLSTLLLCLLVLALLVQAVPAGNVQLVGKRNNITQAFGVPGINATFNYVVVGGGTAGITIASRLESDPSITVAIIEAGGFYEAAGNTSIVPVYTTLYSGTDPADTYPAVDWGDVTVPQAVRQAFRCCLDRFIADTLLIQGANKPLEARQQETTWFIIDRRLGLHKSGRTKRKIKAIPSPTSYLTTREPSTSPVQPYHTRIPPMNRTNRSSVQVEVLCRYRLAITMILLQLVYSQHSERLDRGPSIASKVGDCWGPHMCLRLSTLPQEQDPRRSRVSQRYNQSNNSEGIQEYPRQEDIVFGIRCQGCVIYQRWINLIYR